jgi:uncharacterized protein YndB with AHSA1/START domain
MDEDREAQGSGGSASGGVWPPIQTELRTTASADAVWRAWTTPEGLASWFVDRATGRFEAGAEVVWHWDRFGIEARQIVREVRPGERLLLEGETPQGARFTEVTIRNEAGATVLRVVESGFHEGDDAAAGVASGWRMALEVLRHVLEARPAGQRHQVLCLRPAGASRDSAAWPYRTVTDLSSWLGEPAEPGSAVLRLDPEGAGSFSGRLLLDTGRECLWQWNGSAGTRRDEGLSDRHTGRSVWRSPRGANRPARCADRSRRFDAPSSGSSRLGHVRGSAFGDPSDCALETA